MCFVPSVRPCVHHHYGAISGSHACRDCVYLMWFQESIHPQIACGLLLWLQDFAQPAVASKCYSHQVQWNISTFEALLKKRVPVSWTSQKVQECMVARFDAVRSDIRPSLNTTTAFYLVTECPDLTMLFWGRVQVTTHSYVIRAQPWLDSNMRFSCPTLHALLY